MYLEVNNRQETKPFVDKLSDNESITTLKQSLTVDLKEYEYQYQYESDFDMQFKAS